MYFKYVRFRHSSCSTPMCLVGTKFTQDLKAHCYLFNSHPEHLINRAFIISRIIKSQSILTITLNLIASKENSL